MSIESLAGMFSQRSGADKSMGSSVMSAIIGYLVQKMMGGGSGGIGGMLSGLTGGSQPGGGGGIGSILSSLGGLNKDHELVRHVQQNTGIQDPEQARQYTQHGVDILNEQSKNNPQGLQSILGGFLGSGGGGSQQGRGSSGGGIGDMLGI